MGGLPCCDITYVPVRNGFLYLWQSWIGRRAKCWLAGLQIRWMPAAALRHKRRPSADMGSRKQWIRIRAANIRPQAASHSRYLDNIFIERLWRSLKHQAVYLHEITDGFQAKRILDDWIGFYNFQRPHTADEKRTPNTAYFTETKRRKPPW